MSTLFRTAAALVLALSVTSTAAAHNHNDKTEKPGKNIVETAVAAGSFKTLATALEAAGLVETLQGKGPFTVFAPTDEAFAKIPKEKLAALLKDKDALTKVLTYHVVAGSVTAADVVKLKEATTVQGSTVAISVKGKDVMVNNARVLTTDIMATNGVIHVIDTVIMPKDAKETKKSKY